MLKRRKKSYPTPRINCFTIFVLAVGFADHGSNRCQNSLWGGWRCFDLFWFHWVSAAIFQTRCAFLGLCCACNITQETPTFLYFVYGPINSYGEDLWLEKLSSIGFPRDCTFGKVNRISSSAVTDLSSWDNPVVNVFRVRCYGVRQVLARIV